MSDYDGRRDIVQRTVDDPAAHILSAPRAGDANRDRCVAHLSDCHARGFLDDETFERRRDLALAAEQQAHLTALVTDLPPAPVERRKVNAAARKELWSHRLGRKPWRGLLHAAAAVPLLLLVILPAVLMTNGPHWSQNPVALSTVVTTAVVGVVASLANFIWFMTSVDWS